MCRRPYHKKPAHKGLGHRPESFLFKLKIGNLHQAMANGKGGEKKQGGGTLKPDGECVGAVVVQASSWHPQPAFEVFCLSGFATLAAGGMLLFFYLCATHYSLRAINVLW